MHNCWCQHQSWKWHQELLSSIATCAPRSRWSTNKPTWLLNWATKDEAILLIQGQKNEYNFHFSLFLALFASFRGQELFWLSIRKDYFTIKHYSSSWCCPHPKRMSLSLSFALSFEEKYCGSIQCKKFIELPLWGCTEHRGEWGSRKGTIYFVELQRGISAVTQGKGQWCSYLGSCTNLILYGLFYYCLVLNIFETYNSFPLWMG